jgi:peptidoglycan-N-acetylglucosamine deacetylase
MSKYRLTLILFVLCFTVVILLHYTNQISLWWAFLLFHVFITLVALGAMNIRWNFFMNSISKGKGNQRRLSITFDDGPNALQTPAILSALEAHQAKATFFVIAKNVVGNEELLKDIISKGHTIGSHSCEHNFWYSMKSYAQLMEDLTLAEAKIKAVSGQRVRWFRPPYGVTNPSIAKATKDMNYLSIGWNVRSLDTTKLTDEALFQRVLARLKGDDILLFHDSMEITARVLPRLLQYFKEQQIQVVPLQELINEEPYA